MHNKNYADICKKFIFAAVSDVKQIQFREVMPIPNLNLDIGQCQKKYDKIIFILLYASIKFQNWHVWSVHVI